MAAKKTAGSEGVPKETPKRHTLDALDAALAAAGVAKTVATSLKRSGYFDASLLEQQRMAVRAAFDACATAKERQSVLKALKKSEVGKMRGHAASFAFACYSQDAKRCARELYAIGTLEGTWPQEAAQVELKRLMNLHGVDRVLPHCEAWLTEPHDAARRLLIEAMRPRGVWTGHLTELRENPAPLKTILETVLDDPSRYVQNAAGNCLNDVAKDHPDAVCDWASQWLKGTPSAPRMYIVKRGLRTLVKESHPRALKVLGFGGAEHVKPEWKGAVPKNVKLGDRLRVEFLIENPTKKETRIVVKAELEGPGKGAKPRIARYHIGEAEIPPMETRTVSKAIRFEDRNSQPKLTGAYTLRLTINGINVKNLTIRYAKGELG